QLLAMSGQSFENYADIRVIGTTAKNAAATHTIERFKNDITLLTMKLTQLAGSPAHQNRWTTLRKLGGKYFLVAITKALRPIKFQRVLFFRRLENIGAIYIFIIKRRIYAHQNDIQLMQRHILPRTQF